MSVTARHAAANLRAATEIVPARRRHVLFLWVVALTALAVFGFWAAGPYLKSELRRLEPWQVAAVCCGDIVAALWFLRFAGKYLVFGEPLVEEPAGPHARRAVTLFLVSMVGGLAVDVGVTVYLRHLEYRRYAVAPQVTARVTNLRTNHASLGRNYYLQCAWRHPDTGHTRHVTLRVHAGVAGRAEALARVYELPPGLPSDVVRALTDDQAPHQVTVRYDPAWPARSWLEGVPDDGNGLFWASVVVHSLQAVVAALIALVAWAEAFGPGRAGRVPWWLELSHAVPTAAQIVAIAFMGALDRVLGY